MLSGCANKLFSETRRGGALILPLWFLLAGVVTAFAGTSPSSPSPQSSGGPGSGSASAATLEATLAGMDQAAARFTSVTGDLDYTKVTVIVDDHSTDRGTIAFEKTRGRSPLDKAFRVMLAFREPAEKFVLFLGDKVSLYRPKIAAVEEYDMGGKQDLVEQFLLLGFGTPGSELQKSYQIVWRGEDSLDGERTLHLELTPKSEQAGARLKKIELWLSPETYQPVQQKFWEPSGDYMIARYTNLKLNISIPDRTFRLPLKGKVKFEKR